MAFYLAAKTCVGSLLGFAIQCERGPNHTPFAKQYRALTENGVVNYRKRNAKGFILNCTLPHFHLRDYITQTITTNRVLQNFVGGITPFLSTSVYFHRASLTDHQFRRCIHCLKSLIILNRLSSRLFVPTHVAMFVFLPYKKLLAHCSLLK